MQWCVPNQNTSMEAHFWLTKQGFDVSIFILLNMAKKNGSNSFRMPLHYPLYKKTDYEEMEEWKVDNLLKQYGLDHHVKGSLDEKRKFAMGAFLWPAQF
ncbi:uncharacterized protein LOC130817647 [Amaranthus tricolor]|uniref:uncharacterized protein LOC130817647 n=1 Tax=Amaranthus tricolor TaxID=29722 RepID=UPI00258EAD36|nr:uncharacterized protein LOC130817647 [Amaranthus tricolor]